MTVDLALAELGGPAVDAGALHRLRDARRANRVADTDWFELAYRAYLTGFGALFVVLFLVGAIGDSVLDPAARARVVDHAPAVIGLVAAVAIAIGLRSGSRGGPLALEPAEVRHVLLSPVDRGRALGPLALTQIRHALFVGVASGAVIGLVAARRFGDGRVPWALSGGGALAAIAVAGHGAALVASGHRLARSWCTAIGLVLVAGAAANVADVLPWWPTRLFGDLALWPARSAPVALLAAAAAVGLSAWGWLRLRGVELEAAERRTALAGQLRFAVTMRDLRTVVVLHRLLAQDHARGTPWFTMPGRRPVWRRAWRGITRVPLGRLTRMTVLTVGAGLAMLGVLRGTTPLVVVAALASFVVGLDALETLAQDIDQSDHADSTPRERGLVHVHHLLPATIALLPMVAVAVGAQAILGARGRELTAVALAVLLGMLCGLGGAAVSLLMGAPDPVGRTLGGSDPAMLPPEVTGVATLLRAVWPVMLSGLAALPAIAALRAQRRGADPVGGLLAAGLPVIVALAVVAGYVRFRDDVHLWWQKARADAMKGPPK